MSLNPPLPIRVTTANTDWAKRGDEKYVKHLCEFSDVVVFQEAKDYTLADILPSGWHSLQETTNLGTRGSCIAVRDTVKVLQHGLTLGSAPTWLGRRIRMLPRYIAWAQVHYGGHTYFVVSAHEPPKRFSFLHKGYEKNLHDVVKGHPHTIIGTDANHPLAVLAADFHMRPSGLGIVGVLTSMRLRVVGAEVISNWGIHEGYTDHPSVTVHVIPYTLRHVKQ